MPKNTVGDFIRSVFPSLVNKDGEIFKALFAGPEETGAVEKIFNDLETARNAWCNNSDVYGQSGEMLEKTVSFFSVLKRMFMESDGSFKKRNELLFYRNGDTVWGNRRNLLNIFKAYFETEFVYIANNTDEPGKNILLDGDFEAGNAWTLENCSYDRGARFCGATGVLFDSNSRGSCRQDAAVETGAAYFLHFFLNGVIDIEIMDNHGRYWNPETGEFGEWQAEPRLNRFSAAGWDAKNIFFLTDGTAESVTVNFAGSGGGAACLDYARLFKKENYSSFTLIARLDGRYTEDTMAMAPGTGDPVSNVDYGAMSYIGQSHLFGTEGAKAESVYGELLEIVRPEGIASYIEILTLDLNEQEEDYA